MVQFPEWVLGVRINRQMRVRVDEPGHHGIGTQIYHARALRRGYRRADLGNDSVTNNDGLGIEHMACVGIYEMAGVYHGYLSICQRRSETTSARPRADQN